MQNQDQTANNRSPRSRSSVSTISSVPTLSQRKDDNSVKDRNRAILNKLKGQIEHGDPERFLQAVDKVKTWCSRREAYYKEARPVILDLLETTIATLSQTISLPPHLTFHISLCTAEHVRAQAEAAEQLFDIVRQYLSMFSEEEKRKLIQLLAAMRRSHPGGPAPVSSLVTMAEPTPGPTIRPPDPGPQNPALPARKEKEEVGAGVEVTKRMMRMRAERKLGVEGNGPEASSSGSNRTAEEADSLGLVLGEETSRPKPTLKPSAGSTRPPRAQTPPILPRSSVPPPPPPTPSTLNTSWATSNSNLNETTPSSSARTRPSLPSNTLTAIPNTAQTATPTIAPPTLPTTSPAQFATANTPTSPDAPRFSYHYTPRLGTFPKPAGPYIDTSTTGTRNADADKDTKTNVSATANNTKSDEKHDGTNANGASFNPTMQVVPPNGTTTTTTTTASPSSSAPLPPSNSMSSSKDASTVAVNSLDAIAPATAPTLSSLTASTSTSNVPIATSTASTITPPAPSTITPKLTARKSSNGVKKAPSLMDLAMLDKSTWKAKKRVGSMGDVAASANGVASGGSAAGRAVSTPTPTTTTVTNQVASMTQTAAPTMATVEKSEQKSANEANGTSTLTSQLPIAKEDAQPELQDKLPVPASSLVENGTLKGDTLSNSQTPMETRLAKIAQPREVAEKTGGEVHQSMLERVVQLKEKEKEGISPTLPIENAFFARVAERKEEEKKKEKEKEDEAHDMDVDETPEPIVLRGKGKDLESDAVDGEEPTSPEELPVQPPFVNPPVYDPTHPTHPSHSLPTPIEPSFPLPSSSFSSSSSSNIGQVRRPRTPPPKRKRTKSASKSKSPKLRRAKVPRMSKEVDASTMSTSVAGEPSGERDVSEIRNPTRTPTSISVATIIEPKKKLTVQIPIYNDHSGVEIEDEVDVKEEDMDVEYGDNLGTGELRSASADEAREVENEVIDLTGDDEDDDDTQGVPSNADGGVVHTSPTSHIPPSTLTEIHSILSNGPTPISGETALSTLKSLIASFQSLRQKPATAPIRSPTPIPRAPLPPLVESDYAAMMPYKVISFVVGAPMGCRRVVEFEVGSEVREEVRRWVGRYDRFDDALPSLCISLSCYRVPSEIPDIRKEIVSSGRTPSIEEIAERYFAGTISWPQDNGLDVAIESDSRAPLSFRISPPFDLHPSEPLDLTPSISTTSTTKLTFTQRGDYSNYVFILRSHKPTIAQMRRFKQTLAGSETFEGVMKSIMALRKEKSEGWGRSLFGGGDVRGETAQVAGA